MNVTCTCILFFITIIIISIDGFIDKARVQEAECKVGDLETLVSHLLHVLYLSLLVYMYMYYDESYILIMWYSTIHILLLCAVIIVMCEFPLHY